MFINRLYMAKERISELEDRSIETSQTEKQKNERQQHRISKTYGTITKVVMYTHRNSRRKKGEKGTEAIMK